LVYLSALTARSAPALASASLAALAATLAPATTALRLLAARLATPAAGFARLFRCELVGSTLLMGRLATLAGDLTLLLVVHRGETAPATLAATLTPATTTLASATLAALALTAAPQLLGTRLATLASDLTLLLFVHRSETTLLLPLRLISLLGHSCLLLLRTSLVR
jgi:hypothetical protein